MSKSTKRYANAPRGIRATALAFVVTIALLGLTLAGCSTASPIVGDWTSHGEASAMLRSHSNGDLDGLRGGVVSDQIASEKRELRSDEAARFKPAAGDAIRKFHRLSAKDADGLSDSLYYLSGSTPVVDGHEYVWAR